ncbi:hypothetical protein GCK72_013524 [Caenorhabditis remanei]|uniref:BAR domain-containing protein n=1 Tax=Caenorhabditis remanei TaxID=31234 RepID=A0A6A5GRG7_CAERE|nr:hypothetical protein GCK72_013524 [Caenorhabditis remanei]KAF1757069.1 hypothetical protein GCK72_013524 [Caenorhabditis remanei]
MKRNNKDDILPSQIVASFSKESDGYLKYRTNFKPAYKHFLTCVGLESSDFKQDRSPSEFRCNRLFQSLSALYSLNYQEDSKKFLDEIRPLFESAIATEYEFHKNMKAKLQVINSFFANEFEVKKKEFDDLGPVLEKLQANRPAEPEQIQQLDKVMARFTDLQRKLKDMIREGLAAIQAQHLKVIRECTELYQRQNEQWSRTFAPFAKFKPDVTIKPRKDKEKEHDKASKLSVDDKDGK